MYFKAGLGDGYLDQETLDKTREEAKQWKIGTSLKFKVIKGIEIKASI